MRTTASFLFALAAPMLLAQHTDSYIEIAVTDTTAPALERIIYTVELDGSMSAASEAMEMAVQDATEEMEEIPTDKERKEQRQKEADERAKRRADQLKDLEELKAELRANGFVLSTMLDDRPGYDVHPGNHDEEETRIAVEVRTIPELDRLVAFVKSKGNLRGNVMQWKYADSSGGADGLRSLYAQARYQANELAAAAGRRIGEMISAREPDRSEIVQMMDAVMRKEMRRESYFAEPRPRTMIFRFAFLD